MATVVTGVAQEKASYHHNLIASTAIVAHHALDRVEHKPSWVHMRNNVIYNWGAFNAPASSVFPHSFKSFEYYKEIRKSLSIKRE